MDWKWIYVFCLFLNFLDSKQSPTASTRGTDVAGMDQSEAANSLSPARTHSNGSPLYRLYLTSLPLHLLSNAG